MNLCCDSQVHKFACSRSMKINGRTQTYTVKFPNGCKVDVTSLSQLKEELMTSGATKTLSKTLSLSLQTTMCNLITASQKTWNVSLERK